MQLKFRRVITITFILAFLISAPLLLLYSIGYRFDVKKQKIQSIGALFLDSHPSEINVFLNDKLIQTEMPAKIVNLKPNKYSVNVQKDGYFTWSKELEVSSKLTTFADNIILYKKSIPENLIMNEINLFSPSPDNSKLLYSVINTVWEEIWIMDLTNNENKTLLYRSSITSKEPLQKENVWWNSDSKKILIFNNQNYFILNSENSNDIVFVNDIVNKNLTNIKWDSRNSDIIYGLDKKDIYTINLSNLNTEKISTLLLPFETYEDDYLIKNGEIYYLNQGEKNVRLEKIQINKNIPVYILEVPKTDDYEIIPYTEKYFGLISKKLKKIFLLKIDFENIYFEEISGKNITLNKDGTKLLNYTDFELFTKEMDENEEFKKEYLITRHSKGINEALWHALSEYIFYSTDDSISVIELDGRSKRNNHTLIENFKINQICLDPNSENIYFYGQNPDGLSGIFLLNITDSKGLIQGLGL